MKRPLIFVIGIFSAVVVGLVAPMAIMLVGYGLCRSVAWIKNDLRVMDYIWVVYVVALFGMPAGFIFTLIPFIQKLDRMDRARKEGQAGSGFPVVQERAAGRNSDGDGPFE